MTNSLHNSHSSFTVACPGSVGIEFGTLIYSSDANVHGSYSVGTTVTYECDTNYRLIGMKSLVCESNMEWNGVTPVCEREFCSFKEDMLCCSHTQLSDYIC